MSGLPTSEIKRSMLVYHTTLGVDDWLLVINVCMTIIVVTALRIYVWLFVAVALHFALMVVSRLQPCLLEVYVRFSLQSDRYSPFATARQKRNLRPAGFRGAALR